MLTPPTRARRAEGAPFPVRGRVRTGCLTCRSRKVKCPEERPICSKCAKSNRACSWKDRPVQHLTEHDDFGPSIENLDTQDLPSPAISLSRATTELSPSQVGTSALHAWPDATLSPSHGVVAQADAAEFFNSPSGQALMTSQDIYLCTTIDLMAAREAPLDISFRYFVDEIDIPLISPFDRNNWKRLKEHIRELGARNHEVAMGIAAVQTLYKAQAHALPTIHAMPACHTARAAFHVALQEGGTDVQHLLVLGFLLCLIEVVVPTESGSTLHVSEGLLIERFETESAAEIPQSRRLSPYTLRIVAYLRILHAASRRGGGPGLLSGTVSELLPRLPQQMPTLPACNETGSAVVAIFDNLSEPMFDLYLELQVLSAQVAELSHYHRSRITSTDQEEAAPLLGDLKARMYDTWSKRPSIMRLSPRELRANLSPAVAEPLITLIGLGIAIFHTEIVEIGRTLSDPPLASSEARQHMRHIREVVEGDYNVGVEATINAGYLRPLFLYAIESINPDRTEWAIELIKRINNHICRSDFFASFAKAMAEAQRRKERRVTTKWLCYETFGVPPPCL
jgi:hypothetical protein